MQTTAPVTWIVVADGAQARVLQAAKADGGLKTIAEEQSTLAREQSGTTVTDRPGRFNDGGQAGTHAAGPPTDAQQVEKDKFVHSVAEGLNKAALADAYDRLVVIAPPKVLGTLRDSLHQRASDKVVGTLAKDLTGLPDRQIIDRADVPADAPAPPRKGVNSPQNRP